MESKNLEQKLEGIIGEIKSEIKPNVKKLWEEYENALTDCYGAKFKDYEYEKALGVLEKIIKEEPNNSKVWVKRGDLCSLHLKRDDALRCYDRAIEINPKNTDALVGKAEEYEYEDMPEKALKFYNKALEITPRDIDILEEKASLLIYDLERPREALKVYNQILKIDPENDFAWNDKAEILNSLGEYVGALKCSNKAIGIDSIDGEYYFHKGVALDGLGRFKEAYDAYYSAEIANKAVFDKDNIQILNNQGAAAAEIGRYNRALRCFDKALEISPRYKKAKKNKSIVSKALEKSKKLPDGLIPLMKKVFSKECVSIPKELKETAIYPI